MRAPVGGAQRVHPEHVLDVREDQLLVLLLVIAGRARSTARSSDPLCGASTLREQSHHRLVDVFAVVVDLGDGGPRLSRPRFGAAVAVADGVVVGVEQVSEVRVESSVTGECGVRRNVSKNQLVWARCHLVGLTSGMDCTT